LYMENSGFRFRKIDERSVGMQKTAIYPNRLINTKPNLPAILSLALCFVFNGLCAQETIPASGGNVSGSGGTVSYTIGQVAYTTSLRASYSVARGVQQPYEISIGTSAETISGIKLECKAYPNPATDILTLKISGNTGGNLVYQLFNLGGLLLENKKIAGSETAISMSSLAPATYFLKVTKGDNILKTFKIIKK
jgi:hypothetical protein